jgi:hypothetical protein
MSAADVAQEGQILLFSSVQFFRMSGCSVVFEALQPLTEMSTRHIKTIMFLGSKVRRVHKADELTDCLHNVGSLTSHNPIGLHSLLRGWLYFMETMCFLRGTNWTVSTATSSQYLAVNCEPTV